MNKLCLASILFLALPLAACGDDDAASGDDDVTEPDGGGTVVDAGGEPDADWSEWTSLIEGDWSLPALKEDYVCVVKTIPSDMYISTFKPMIPLGTHHTVLTLYDGNKADGTYPCNAGENGQSMIYGSGVGSPEFVFPEGVAVKLTAGQKIMVNLHLFNTQDAVLTGHSGIFVKTTEAAAVEHQAEVVLAGPLLLNLPAGAETVQTGKCTLNTDEPLHIFAVAAHMHQLGRHLRTFVIHDGVETLIQDTDYMFDDQSFSYKEPMFTLMPGDVLRTECTYKNTTPNAVHWGDSSQAEMCFSDVMYYPAQGAQFICWDGLP